MKQIKETKKMTLAITMPSLMLSLMLLSATVGLGQSKSRARVKPAPVGGQICTGCCDPCYSDDGWNVHQQQPAIGHPNAVNPAGKSRPPAKGRKGKR